jgi:translocation and assembly module TamB
MLGGTVSGDAEVKHYAPAMEVTTAEVSSEQSAKPEKPSAGSSSSAKKPVATKPAALPVMQGTANLKVGGASLMEVVRMLTSRDVPVEKLNLAGVVNGTVNIAFTGSISRSILVIAADSVAKGMAENGQLPVSGTFRGRYDVATSSTDIAALNLATPHSEASASGILRTHAADLKFAVNSNSLAEFQPLLSAMGQQPLPLEIKGRASLSGALGGPLIHPEIQGRLIATDVTYLYTPAAPAPHPTSTMSKLESALHIGHPGPEVAPPPPPRRIHVDSFAGDLQYGPTLLALHNGVVEQSAMHLNVDGSVQLENGKFTDHSPIDLHASLHNASLADLQKVVGSDYPVSGLLNGSFQVSGTRDDLHGQGTLALSEAEVHGHTVNVAAADVAVVGQEVQFHNIRVAALGGTAAGSLAYNFDNRQMRSDLHGENIDLAQITEIQALPVQQHGTASFSLKVAGTPDLPQMEAHLDIADLVINDELAGGGLSFELVSHGRNLQVTGRSHLADASLTVDGTVEMQGDLQSDLKLEFSRIDVDPLLRAHVKAQITKHSELAGRASLAGPLRRPRALKGNLLIDAFSVEVERILLHTDGPVELGFHDGVLAVDRLMLTAEDSHVSLAGTVDLTGDRPLDLAAKGHINLGIIHTLEGEINSYGTADQDVTIRGTLSKPVLDGRVVIAHAGFSVVDLPAALGELNGTMVFNQDRLEVEHLSGRVGGGQVNFGGFISYGDAIAFDLNSNGRDIRFRYGGVSVTADQELRLNGTLKSSTLSGVVTITRFAQIPSGDFGAAFVPQPAVIPDPRSPLNNLRLDVRIVSAPELTVQTSLAKLSGDVDMKLRGTGTRPTLLGRINIAEGEINLSGTKYHLDRGDITFANPVRIDPILDMEATTRVRDFDITIGLHGTLEKLTTTYRSDPPLSSDDIIALLAFGRTQEESYTAGRSSSLGQGAGSLVLGEAVNQVVSNRVSKLFGVSAIRINPAIGGPDNNPNARITVVQQVSNNVTLTYITNLTQSAQQVIQFEYNINANYTLQGVRDENGVVSFVVLIRARRK